MKEISLTRGKVVIVDDDDYEKVNRFKWYAFKAGRKHELWYACRHARKEMCPGTPFPCYRIVEYMHRIILTPEDGYDIDHIDGNGLNNKKSNLRLVTRSQNSLNRHCKV